MTIYPSSQGRLSTRDPLSAIADEIGAVVCSARQVVGKVINSFAAREIALVLFGYFAYFYVRGLTEGSREQAVANSHSVVDFEKAAGFFWEPAIQERIVDCQWLVNLANWIYIWGHWPLIATVATWLLFKHRESFTLFRTAFFISGAIGVAVFVMFPVAPPRLAEIGLVDTVTQHSHAYRVLQPQAFTNQYAAVPSLHFGWDLLIGIALVTNAKILAIRIFGAVVPALMFAAIVLTANHYLIDAAAGGAVALTGLGLALALRAYGHRIADQFRSPYQRAVAAA